MRMIAWGFDVLKMRILAQVPREAFIFGPIKSTRKISKVAGRQEKKMLECFGHEASVIASNINKSAKVVTQEVCGQY